MWTPPPDRLCDHTLPWTFGLSDSVSCWFSITASAGKPVICSRWKGLVMDLSEQREGQQVTDQKGGTAFPLSLPPKGRAGSIIWLQVTPQAPTQLIGPGVISWPKVSQADSFPQKPAVGPETLEGLRSKVTECRRAVSTVANQRQVELKCCPSAQDTGLQGWVE